ncbi:hypothetical protein [uncultured Faecalibaculum sp.]|uniref:hypothetical protein n=1 Tax=uncultured Faecalibaculum sp. TaxID=1729681 RepID=UPI002611C46C|nr:hypothetical protein [uncultured Faecalibaculum sp.]
MDGQLCWAVICLASFFRDMEDGKKPLPMLDIILYYGKKPWQGPKTLREYFGPGLYDRYRDLCWGNSIFVIDLGALADKEIQSLESDLGEVARAVKAIREKRAYTGSRRKLKHFVAVSRLLAELTGRPLTKQQLGVLGDMSEEEQTMEMALEFLMKDKFAQSWNLGQKEGEMIGLQKGARVYDYLSRQGRTAEYLEILADSQRLEAVLREIGQERQ